jgi:hypothetical protein
MNKKGPLLLTKIGRTHVTLSTGQKNDLEVLPLNYDRRKATC